MVEESIRPMEGGGAYNRGSRVQAAGLEPAISLFEAAARVVPLPAGAAPIIIADYGCSEGGNSIAPIAAAIAALRPRLGVGEPIEVVHTDLPGNDFSALFKSLAADPDSYLAHDSNVFAYAAGRSYFEQILPADSVSLGWSSWSIQWLSRTPAAIPDHVQVSHSRDAEARAAFAAQAAEDWRSFLAHRSREMKAGARLVVLTIAADDQNRFSDAPLLEALYAALEAMAAEGFIARAELARMAIPTLGRARADFLAPFSATGRFEGLALSDFEIFAGEDRIWADFERTRDASAFSAQWARFTRSSVFPTLAGALDEGDAQRSAAFVERLETDVAQRLSEKPQRMAIPLAKMVVSKA